MFRVKSDFLLLDTLLPYLDAEVEIVTGKNGKQYIYKSVSAETKDRTIEIAESNAAFGYLYRIIMGPLRAPTTIALIDEERVGVLSEFIDKYASRAENPEAIIKDIEGFARMLVAAFFLGERDLSESNYGFEKSGLICKIDHDLSGTDSVNRVDEFKSDFAVSFDRLAQFPLMSKIFNWPKRDIDLFNKINPLLLQNAIQEAFVFLRNIPEKSMRIVEEFFSDKIVGKRFASHYIDKLAQISTALQRDSKEEELLKVKFHRECVLNTCIAAKFYSSEEKSEDRYVVTFHTGGGKIVSGEDPLESFDDVVSPADEMEIYSQLGYKHKILSTMSLFSSDKLKTEVGAKLSAGLSI